MGAAAGIVIRMHVGGDTLSFTVMGRRESTVDGWSPREYSTISSAVDDNADSNVYAGVSSFFFCGLFAFFLTASHNVKLYSAIFFIG